MGTTYTVVLGVGFVLDMDNVTAPFRSVTPEVSHMEDRFSTLTGVRLEPVKIVTRYEGVTYTILDKTYHSDWEVVEVLSRNIGFKFAVIGGLNERGARVMFCANNPYEGTECGSGFSLVVHEGGFPVTQKWTETLQLLRDRLEELGINPGVATIQLCCSYG